MESAGLPPPNEFATLIGLAWIAVYYATNGQLVGMPTLGDWNLVIGFVLIIGGVILATRWR